MEKFLPLFPLNLVVYPEENLNLHIFEPRYRQLIREVWENQSTFGIPSFIEGKMNEYGTEIKITEIAKIYSDGRMDIRTQGIDIFRLLSFNNPVAGKLYAGGLVYMTENQEYSPYEPIKRELMAYLKELYQILKAQIDIDKLPEKNLSYHIAHKIGLSIQQEYELLTIESEEQRQVFLTEHLKKSLPVVKEIERTKQLIQMNGHFKHLQSPDF
ncbi:MAG: peptidase [Cytophagales bacterium]|nr:MAG: peptidase [Cytophagales bacterium]